MIRGEPLASNQAFLLVRARIDPKRFPEFLHWYHDTLRPHMLAIPGIIAAHTVMPPADDPGQWLRIYEFAGEGELEAALEGEEARQARRDWTQWSQYVHDLTIEVYAPLAAAPVLNRWN